MPDQFTAIGVALCHSLNRGQSVYVFLHCGLGRAPRHLYAVVVNEHPTISVLRNLHRFFFGLYRFRRAGVSFRLNFYRRRGYAHALPARPSRVPFTVLYSQEDVVVLRSAKLTAQQGSDYFAND